MLFARYHYDVNHLVICFSNFVIKFTHKLEIKKTQVTWVDDTLERNVAQSYICVVTASD